MAKAEYRIFSINGEKLDKISANEEVYVLLDQSPFYAESGSNWGSRFLRKEEGQFKVLDTQKQGISIFIAVFWIGRLEGKRCCRC